MPRRYNLVLALGKLVQMLHTCSICVHIQNIDTHDSREYVTHVSGSLPSNNGFDLEEIVTAPELELPINETMSFNEEGLQVWKTSMENEKHNYFQGKSNVSNFK
mmetsp:Transcript_10706/g.13389  ORF Transcript_10706/g.13389 Transcript_10706/m.13389 type:complete len:104 (+) Transcript_10706:180-491(+)